MKVPLGLVDDVDGSLGSGEHLTSQQQSALFTVRHLKDRVLAPVRGVDGVKCLRLSQRQFE